MENSLNVLSRMVPWQKNKLLKFFIRFYQHYSTWNAWEFLTGISNLKIFFLIVIGMRNWLILGSAAKIILRKNEWEGQFVELLLILLLKFFSKRSILRSSWMCGPSESPFTLCWQLKCLLKAKHLKKDALASSIADGTLKPSSALGSKSYWMEFLCSPHSVFYWLIFKIVNLLLLIPLDKHHLWILHEMYWYLKREYSLFLSGTSVWINGKWLKVSRIIL